MKILNDHSFFQDMPPLTYSREDFRTYYSCAPSVKAICPIRLRTPFTSPQPFYINVLFRGKTRINYHYRQENYPYLGVEYVREGSLAARQNDRCYLIEPGEIFLLQPRQDSEIATGPDGFCVKDSFSVRGDLLKPFLASSKLGERDFLCDFDWQRLEYLLQEIQEIALDDLIKNSALTYEILEVLAFSKKKSTVVPELTNLLDFMRSNLRENLTLDDLAAHVGYSKTNLLLSFRSVYGKTPHQKLIEMRMEHAAKLLLEHWNLTVKEIAEMVGHPNPMNFSTAFRQYYGSAPRQYRNDKINENMFL